MSEFLGTPNWLSILHEEGVLALMDQELELWKHKSLWAGDNIIRVKSFKSASELLVEAVKRHRINWADFCTLLPWQMAQAVMARVNGKPARDFRSLAVRLQDFIGMQTELDNWIAASGITGSGVLINNRRNTVPNYLSEMKNQHPERLRLLGAVLKRNRTETQAIMDTIKEYGFAADFGLDEDRMQVDTPLPSMQTTDYKSILRRKLNPAYAALGNDAAKDAHIASVLQSERINKFFWDRIPWFLPNNATLSDLLEFNKGLQWAELVAVLVDIAESQLGELDHLFPTTDALKTLREKLADCEANLPFLELAFYSPSTPRSIREKKWRELAPTIISPDELLYHLNLPGSMASKQLSNDVLLQLWDRLTVLLDQDHNLRGDILNRVEQHPEFKPAHFEMIESLLFPKWPAKATIQYKCTVPEPWTWPGGQQFLANINIKNDALAAQLDECHNNGYFAATTREHWPAQLVQLGAVGMQPLAISTELFKVGLIH